MLFVSRAGSIVWGMNNSLGLKRVLIKGTREHWLFLRYGEACVLLTFYSQINLPVEWNFLWIRCSQQQQSRGNFTKGSTKLAAVEQKTVCGPSIWAVRLRGWWSPWCLCLVWRAGTATSCTRVRWSGTAARSTWTWRATRHSCSTNCCRATTPDSARDSGVRTLCPSFFHSTGVEGCTCGQDLVRVDLSFQLLHLTHLRNPHVPTANE